MKSSYIFGAIFAVIIVVGGFFLLGRDGTESLPLDITSKAVNTVTEQELPPPNPPTPLTNSEQTSSVQENEENNPSDGEEEPVIEDEEPTVVGDAEPAASEEEELSSQSSVVTVTYTKSGYSPKEVTIEWGETVVWVNESGRNMRVSANIHPTHTQYPESSDGDCLGSSFDGCTGIPDGETWEFTFNSVGEWGYHDHLSASRTGTVVVE